MLQKWRPSAVKGAPKIKTTVKGKGHSKIKDDSGKYQEYNNHWGILKASTGLNCQWQ